MTTLVILVPENAPAPMDSTLGPMFRDSILLQPLKALLPIDTRESGRSIVVSPVQAWNALLPIDFRVSGRSIVVIFVQPWNALFPMLVTLSPMSISVSFQHLANALEGIEVRVEGRVSVSRLPHPVKMPFGRSMPSPIFTDLT